MDGKTFTADLSGEKKSPCIIRYFLSLNTSLLLHSLETFLNYHPLFSSSSLVNHILYEAFEKGRKFRVIVVDSRPRLEGRETLRRLVQRGISCTYVLISAVSYILPEANTCLYFIMFFFFHCFVFHTSILDLVGVKGFPRCSCSAGQWLCYVSCGDFSDCSGCKGLQRTCAGVL